MQVVISEVIGAVGQVILFSIIPFVAWLIAGRKKENFFKWIGIRKGNRKSSWKKIIGLSALALAGYIALTIASIKLLPDGVTLAGSQFAGLGASAIPAAIAYAFIRTALSEEIIFRGFILKRVASKFGFAAGNLVQAIAFGLMHGIPFGIATHNIGTTILLTLLPGAMGWFMGWLNEKNFEGSILPSWMMHGLINVTVTLLNL